MTQPWRCAAGVIAISAGLLLWAGNASAKFSGVDGNWLVFQRASGGGSDIFVARPGGPGVNITPGPGIEERPAWDRPPSDAPCGPSVVPTHHRIAYDSHAPGAKADIFIADVGGLDITASSPALSGSPTNITNSPQANDTAPAWWSQGFLSPANTPTNLLAFTSDRDVNQDGVPDRDIFVADETGANLVNITQNDADDANPEWSPDGTHIAFESTRSGTRQIWAVSVTVDATGHTTPGTPYQVTTGPEPKHDPTWLGHSPQFGTTDPEDGQLVYSVDVGGRSYLDTIVQTIPTDVPNAFEPFTGPNPSVTEPLTGAPGDATGPAWSPGAYGVVFATTAGGATPFLAILRGSDSVPFALALSPAVVPAGNDTNPDWEPVTNCAAPHPIMPAPAPVTRTPKGQGNGGTTTGSPSGGGALPAAGPLPPPKPDACTIRGDSGANVLRGTPRADVICGGGGDDRIVGAGGNDVIDGGPGRDRIAAGPGNDRVTGGPGPDTIVGGRGSDRIDGGRGADTLLAKDHARDRLFGGSGRDTARVDRGLDRVAQIERRRFS